MKSSLQNLFVIALVFGAGFYAVHLGVSLEPDPVKGATLAAWVQAIGSIAAIIGAIWIASDQQRRAARATKDRLSSVRGTVLHIAQMACKLADEVHDPMNEFGKIGTWDQYRAFRGRQFAEFRAILEGISSSDLIESGMLQFAAALRINLQDMAEIIKESDFRDAEGWRVSRRMIDICRPNFVRIETELTAMLA